MAKKVNPALFIGLGGAGYKTLLKLKKSVIRHYGEVPPCIRFLCFDTDVAPLKSAQEELTFIPDGESRPVTKKIGFEESEYITIPLKNPDKLKDSNYIKKWLSEKVEPMIVPGANGARQIRQLGRFAFFENIATQRIDETIQGHLHEIMDADNFQDQCYRFVGTEPTVHMVFTPCGGTGAGIFLDVAMSIKTNIRSMGFRVNAWMIGPDFYTPFPATGNVVPNTYASLIEIDHLMGKDNTKDKPWSNYDTNMPFTVDYGNGVGVNLGVCRFLDFVFLFDNVMKDGTTIDKVEDVYARIGSLLYLMVSGPGDDIFETMAANMEAQDMFQPSSDITGKKRRNYTSIGIAQIIMGRDYIRDYRIIEGCIAILNEYLQPGVESTVSQEDCDAFIAINQLREDKGEDQVTNRLLPREYLNYDMEGLLPAEMEIYCNEELTRNATRFLGDWEIKLNGIVKDEGKQIYESFKEELERKIIDLLKAPGNLPVAKTLLAELDASFKAMKDEMEEEAAHHKATADNLKKRLETYILPIKEEETSFMPIGKDARIRTECMNYLGQVEKILSGQCDLARKTSAGQLFGKIQREVQKKNRQVSKLDNLFTEVSKSLAGTLQQLREQQNSPHDGQKYIHEYAGDLLKITQDLEAAMDSIDFSAFMGAKKVEDITRVISAYVETTGDITDVDNLTIEGVLESLDEKTVTNVFQYLDNTSQVCLQIDESFAMGTPLLKMTKLGFICVEDKETSIFKEGSKFLDIIDSADGYNTTPYTTGNRDFISMVKSEGTFPACSILKMKEYKKQYDMSVEEGNFHHSDTYFAENAQDLFKDDSVKDALLYFGIGSALGIICCTPPSGYVIKMPGEEKGLFEAGSKNQHHRTHAFNYFKKVKEYVDFIKEEYEQMAKSDPLGIKKCFFAHFHNLYDPSNIGKAKTSLSESELAHLQKERMEVANFAIYEAVHMTPTEYMQSKDNGSITEVCTEQYMRDAGIEV